MKLSIIIPVYNENATVLEILKKLKVFKIFKNKLLLLMMGQMMDHMN